MKDANFLFVLETLSETIPYTRGMTVKEGLFDFFKGQQEETFGDKVKSVLETAKDYVQVLIDTAKGWFNIVTGEYENVDTLFRLAGGVTFGSLALLVIAILYKAGKVVLGESTAVPENVVVTTESVETVFKELELGITVTGDFSKVLYAYIVLACLGLVAIIIANTMLKESKLSGIVAAWSVLQIAASGYTFYYVYKKYGSDENFIKLVDDKVMTILGIIVGGLGILTGVTVTVPAVVQLLKGGPSGAAPTREQVDEMKKVFDEVKDTPEAQDIRAKIVSIYDKAMKA